MLWSDNSHLSIISQDVPPNEYYNYDNNQPEEDYNDYNENLELHGIEDDIDTVHLRGFGSNKEQDDSDYRNVDKENDWEILA